MSDYIIKIIPTEPLLKLQVEKLQEVKRFLEDNLTCDEIEITNYETPAFIDCGENLERIFCLECGKEISFDWWHEAMDEAYEETEFKDLDITLPCCGKEGSLNTLRYDFACGFACCVVNIMNPWCQIENEVWENVQKMMGVGIRLIHAHY